MTTTTTTTATPLATMTAHLAAIRNRLATAHPAYTAIDLFAPEPGRTPTFLVLEAPPMGADLDAALCDTRASFTVDIRLRAVGGTPTGVDIILWNARNSIPGTIDVPGRHVTIDWTRSELLDVDPDTTIPGTNRHPAVGVDTYTLTSQPA